jgi:hypothetical protein
MSHRIRVRPIIGAVVVYAAWLVALSAARVNVTDPGGKVWDLRLRQVWRVASSGVRQHAPYAESLYAAALVSLVFTLPAAVWVVARAGDDRTAEIEREPERAEAAPADMPSSMAGAAWRLCASALVAGSVMVLAPRAMTNGFASGAHGWHIDRAMRWMSSGRPAWIADHQGGYPIDSVPLGVTAVTVALSALTGGRVPIAYLHTLLAVAIFLLPVLAFAWIARRDGWPPGVAATAAAFHLLIPGVDGSGGYRGIVTAGQVNDAAAAACVLFLLPLTANAPVSGSRARSIAAALCGGAAVWFSPSSVLLLAIVALAAPPRNRRATLLIVALVSLLCAPVWLPLLTSITLHPIVPPGYDSLANYAFELFSAVTPPLIVLAAFGIAIRRTGAGQLPVARVALIVVGISAAATAIRGMPYIEIPRLLPFARLLLLYLASIGLYVALRMTAHALGTPRAALDAAHLFIVIALAVIFAGPFDTVPPKAKSLYPPPTFAAAEVADLASALDAAARAAPRGSAVLIVDEGAERISMSAPVLREGLYFYSDPGWHWRKAAPLSFDNTGDPRWLAEVPRLLSSSALEARGIGAVVAARAAWPAGVHILPMLRHVHAGQVFDTFVVRNASRVVRWNGDIGAIDVRDGGVRARGVLLGGNILVRQNWHPRWRAVLNGRAAAIHETPEGFMRIAGTPGPVDLQLSFREWFAQ